MEAKQTHELGERITHMLVSDLEKQRSIMLNKSAHNTK